MDSVFEFALGVACGVGASIVFVVAILLDRGDR